MTLEQALLYAYKCACELGDTEKMSQLNELYLILFGNSTKRV